MNTDTQKQKVEAHLLGSIQELDDAVWVITNRMESGYHKTVSVLLKARADIKRELNKHFDACARNK